MPIKGRGHLLSHCHQFSRCHTGTVHSSTSAWADTRSKLLSWNWPTRVRWCHPPGRLANRASVHRAPEGAGRIVLPFTGGEVNLVMQPGRSGSAAVIVLLDGKPVGDARGADVGADGVARFDRAGMIRLIARRAHVDPRPKRSRRAGVRIHFRTLEQAGVGQASSPCRL